MTRFSIQHHQVIESALNNFNADFFYENKILFGGGTRIALDLNEFRTSIDIDFLCPDKSSGPWGVSRVRQFGANGRN